MFKASLLIRQQSEPLLLLSTPLSFNHLVPCTLKKIFLFIPNQSKATWSTTYYHSAVLSLFSRSAPSSPDVSPQSSPRPPRANNDRLTLLTRLVRKGEKKGLFVEKMPASIYQVTWHQAACVQLGKVRHRGKGGSPQRSGSSHISICVLARW